MSCFTAAGWSLAAPPTNLSIIYLVSLKAAKKKYLITLAAGKNIRICSRCRCRFWSAVLGDDSSSSTATNQQQNAQPKEHTTPTDGDITSVSAATLASTSPSVPPLLLSDGTALPRIIAAAATALESNNTPAALLAGNDQGNLAGWGSRLATESPSPATARLLKTLQQVAVHRVQQIYARLNGISALEGSGSRVTPATTKTTDRYGTATDTKKTNHIDETRAAVDDAEDADMSSGEGGAADKDQNDGMDEDERLETEARRLVAFACGACESRSVCGGGGGIYRTVVWGDENRVGVNDRGASWSMMMPYLPVWVGFAATEQVSGCGFAVGKGNVLQAAQKGEGGGGGARASSKLKVSDVNGTVNSRVAEARPFDEACFDPGVAVRVKLFYRKMK